MGRPSLQLQRQEEILDAAQQLVLDEGLSALTPVAVARRVGLDRSTVHHYFSHRQALVAGLASKIVEGYLGALEHHTRPDNPEELLDWLFDGGMMLATYDRLTDELHAAHYTDADVAGHLLRLYQTLENRCVEWLTAACPEVSEVQVKQTAYAVYALIEGAHMLRGVGFDLNRMTAAKQAAAALINQLRTEPA